MKNTEQHSDRRTPIVVGVTGHRDIREEDIPALETAVKAELNKLKAGYPNSPVRMLNALAAGADQLCARAAVELGIPLYCPIPMPEEDYCTDFNPDELAVYRSLRDSAAAVFVAPHTEPKQEGRDYLYRQSGVYIAAHCHVLLSLWDGVEDSPLGCGTAAITALMQNSRFADTCAFHTGSVIHITTPRKSRGTVFPVTVSLLENPTGSLHAALSAADRTNRTMQKGDF